MPINVVCGECGNKYRMPDKFAGRSVPCKSCSADIEVPGDDDFETSRPSRRSGKVKKKKKGGGLGVWPLVAGVGLVGVLLVGGGVWAAMSLKKKPANPVAGVAPVTVPLNFPPPPTIPAPANTPPAFPGSNPASIAPKTDVNQPADKPVPVAMPSSGKNDLMGTGFGTTVGISEYWRLWDTPQEDDAEYQALLGAPDSLPPDLWEVTPDEPSEPLSFELEKKTPRVRVPVAGKRTNNGSIVFPVVPSPFVAVGANEEKDDVREVWDLRTGKKVHSTNKLLVKTHDVALSPDGRFFAGVTTVRGVSDPTISVYDFESNEAVFDQPSKEWAQYLGVGFPRSDLLLIMDSGQRRSLEAWTMPSGDKRYELDIGKEPWTKFPPVFSPMGKYLAWTFAETFEEKIGIYDLDQGKLVGRMSLPEYDIQGRLQLAGLAFSRDGRELAALLNGSKASKIVIYNLADGQISEHMTFPKLLQDLVTGEKSSRSTLTFNPLVFFADGKRILAFEHGVIDRQAGELVWSVPRSPADFGGKRWPLNAAQLTVMDVAKDTAFVTVQELPEAKLAEAVKKAVAKKQAPVEEDQSVVIGVADKLTIVRGNGKTANGAIGWKFRPEPRPAENQKPYNLTLTAGTGSVQQFAVSGGAAPKAAVMRGAGWTTWKRIPRGNVTPRELHTERFHSVQDENADDKKSKRLAIGRGSGRSRCWVDLYDLNEKKLERQIRLTYDADLVGLSPDGTRILLWAATRTDRLDLYDTGDGSFLASWQTGGGLMERHHLTGARMVDSNHVATLNSQGELTLWQTDLNGNPPSIRRHVTFSNAAVPAVSPCGRYVGYFDGRAYQVADVKTGEPLGQIANVGSVNGAAFHPDGTRLALSSEYDRGYYLFTVDLATGKPNKPIPVPIISPFLEWCGDKYVLLNERKLVDVEQGAVVWSYWLPKGDQLPGSFDNRHWYLAARGDSKSPVLAGLQLPTPAALSQLEGATVQPEYLLEPGGTCSVSVKLESHAHLADKVLDAVTKELARRNITVADDQRVTLMITAVEKSFPSITQEFRQVGGGQTQSVSYSPASTECKFQFLAGSEVAWETTSVASKGLSFVTLEGNETISGVIESGYKGYVEQLLTTAPQFPPYIFTPTSANGIGLTELTVPEL